ncbi:MAG TPA: aldo/keto reductase [Isosphaeraceae bacterium]|jgi:aryl-alcohol dehydrogenase-like predicted oxidoreductase
MPLPHRPLGKTGVQVPVLGYGTAPLGKIKLMDAPLIHKSARLLNHAIDRGITYLDTSPDYGSQAKLGEVMKTRRDEVFLATKINKRRRTDVLAELRQNLKELQTDHVDLVQVHAVNTMADLETALAPDGAVAALEEARRQGMTRFVGITGHARPWVLARALERYDFDTVLVAIGPVDRLVNAPEEILLPLAQAKQAGVIAMKVYGHGEIKQRELALRYALSLPGVSLAIVGMEEESQIDENVRLAESLAPLGDGELDTLLDEAKGLLVGDEPSDRSPVFWIYDTKVMAWQEDSEPALARY